MRKLLRYFFLSLLLSVPVSRAGAAITTQNAPAVIAQISPTAITYPTGYPNGNPPYLTVQGDTTASAAPKRIVMEFALASVSSGGNITSAYLDVTRFGGQRWQGELQYRLFGYSGTGSLDLNSGLGGLELAGPFFYDIDIPSSNLIHADVTSYLRSLVTMGATHVGFSFRDTFTAPNFGTDGQYLVVQDSPFWAGDVPPKLTIVQEINPVPEPTGVFTGLLCLGLATARRRRR